MSRLATIFCGRDLKVHPKLIAWLLHEGFKWGEILFHRGGMRNNAVDYNHGVLGALESGAEELLFADCDVEPGIKETRPLLESSLDLVCAKCPTECGEKSWPDEGAFHTALWRTRLEVIRDIGMPLFSWPTSWDGAHLRGCVCKRLADKARKLGYSVGNAGEAGHEPRQRCNQKSLVIKT